MPSNGISKTNDKNVVVLKFQRVYRIIRKPIKLKYKKIRLIVKRNHSLFWSLKYKEVNSIWR